MVMAPSGRVKNAHELIPAQPVRPEYHLHDRVRNSKPLYSRETRLIYFDSRCAAEILDDLGSAGFGYELVAQASGREPADIALYRNRRAIFSAMIQRADDLNDRGMLDLHQSSSSSRRITWSSTHPEQVVAIAGEVSSPQELRSSGFRINFEGTSIHVVLNRENCLHRNYEYLVSHEITVVGKVQSVSGVEVIAGAIGVSVDSGLKS